MRVLISLLLVGCVSPGPLKVDHDELGRILKNISVEMAMECAPREYAEAQSSNEFARLELEQGDTRRAREHLDVGLLNARSAHVMATECVPKDTDGDGIMDRDDACPEEPEDLDGVEDEDGCPEGTGDSDGDGIIDQDDECPHEAEDADGFEDEDGCPDPDNDADGISDIADECPLAPEDIDGFEDDNGCPDPDNDADGIPDDEDDCPLEPENVNEYFDEDGCPDEKPEMVKVIQNRIVIAEKIQFGSGRATILRGSFDVLDAVSTVLTQYPKLQIRIEGHTDSDGGEAMNQKLSERRAGAVRSYLVKAGINPVRVESVGFGELRPMASNRSASGKATNRRVEFHIVHGMGD
jgi:outer membrane protein OmpA-like peptidoglycan-associated protein